MSRFFRLSLAQSLLLVALAAFAFAVGAEVWRKYGSGVTSNHPVLAIAPDGKTLAMNCSFRPLFQHRHPIILKETDRPFAPAKMLESHDWIVSDVAWSADGSKLYSTSGDHTVRVWDVASGEELAQIHDKNVSASCLAVSPDERFVATDGGTANPVVHVWDINQENAIATLKGHKRWIWALATSPDGKYLVSSSIDDELRIWDTSSWQLVNTVKLTSNPRHLEFTSGGQLVTRGRHQPTQTEPYDVCVSVLEIPSGRVVSDFPIRNTYATVSSIALSKSGRFLAAAHGGDRNKAHSAVTIWEFTSKQELGTLEVYDHGNYWIQGMEFSLDGETLYCASDDGRVTAQRWRNGDSELIFRRPGGPWKLALIGSLVWIMAWRNLPRKPETQV